MNAEALNQVRDSIGAAIGDTQHEVIVYALFRKDGAQVIIPAAEVGLPVIGDMLADSVQELRAQRQDA